MTSYDLKCSLTRIKPINLKLIGFILLFCKILYFTLSFYIALYNNVICSYFSMAFNCVPCIYIPC